jgi:hypothetical protein
MIINLILNFIMNNELLFFFNSKVSYWESTGESEFGNTNNSPCQGKLSVKVCYDCEVGVCFQSTSKESELFHMEWKVGTL